MIVISYLFFKLWEYLSLSLIFSVFSSPNTCNYLFLPHRNYCVLITDDLSALFKDEHCLESLILRRPSLLGQRRQWHPTPVLLPGKSYGRRSLVGCSPWGCEESDTTEQLHFHFSLSCIREGNGNPLQCSCLENPRDGGAGCAAISGVAQSRTWLKWLSSSSSTQSKALM